MHHKEQKAEKLQGRILINDQSHVASWKKIAPKEVELRTGIGQKKGK